jgi:hypothetical protein
MVEMIRFCPDCDRNRLFEQHHAVTGVCPDSSDIWCPEWLCTACGAALLVRFAVLLPEAAPGLQAGRSAA